MADDVIERLELEISSDSNSANNALNILIGNLVSLKNHLKGLGNIKTDGLKSVSKDITLIGASVKSIENLGKGISEIRKLSEIDLGNISQIADGAKTISSSLSELNSIKLDISGITEPLKDIEKIEIDTSKLRKVSNDIKKLTSIDAGAIPGVSEGVKKIARSVKTLSNVNTKESGVNNTVNALRRLMSIDAKGFKAGNYTKVINSIGSLAKIPDVSGSTNRLVSSIARIAKAGSSGKEASTGIAQLGQTLKKTVKSFVGMENVSESVNSFIQSISKLAMVGSKAGQSAAGLGELSKALKSLFNDMKDMPQIRESTIRMTEALAQLSKTGAHVDKSTGTASHAFEKLGKAANTASGILTTAIKKIASAIKKNFSGLGKSVSNVASGIVSASKKIASSFTSISHSTKGLNNASFGLGNLLKTALGFRAVTGLAQFSKSAVGLGSDITEVENVVDTAFGSMAQKAYDFASTAAEQFGLSELAAKKYSGTMMAMLQSSGVAQGAAADMSIALAGLAGDIASFYNIETDEAFIKLRSAIGGETEPMKQLGINMNIVNLEAFAMSQGIHKAYSEMTLAEQTLLRYNYILDKTKFAQGDFAKTAGTFANQIRILRLNIQSIAATIGQGLIAAILPAIKVLNKLMEKLKQAAKVFRDFMYVLTGKKIETTPKGIVDETAGMVDYDTDLSGIGEDSEEAADGVDDVTDSMDGAADSAKKLKKALSTLPFDQLNQLTGNLDDLDSYSSSKDKNKKDKDKGLDDLGLGDMSDLFDDAFDKEEIQPVNEWARRLREAFLAGDWEELGKTIAEMLNTGLQKVYKVIKDITPKVEKALRNFAKVFNAFVKYFDWELLGRTIGAGVNLLARAFNALTDEVNGIDFVQLGRKLSVGFRGMVDEIDWKVLGNAIGNGFMVAWRIAYGFVTDMWRIDPDTLLTGWAETGIALAEGVEGIFEKINFAQIGKTLSDGFNGIVEIIRNFRNEMASNQTWSMIARNISDGLNNVIDNIDLSGMAHQLSGLLLDLLRMLNDAAEMTHWEDFGYKVGEALASIPWLDIFNQVFDLVAATFGRALGGFINYLATHAEQLGQDFAGMFNGIFDKLKYITDNFPSEDIANGISTWLNTVIDKIAWEENGKKLNDFFLKLLNTLFDVAQKVDWEGLGEGIGNFLSEIDWKTIFGKVFGILKEVVTGLISGFAGTTAGDMAIKLTTAIGGISLAKSAFPLVDSLVKGFTGSSVGSHLISGVKALFAPVTGLFAPGGFVYESFGMGAINLSIALEGLTGAAVPVGASMGIIAAAIAAVVAAVVDLWNTSEVFRDTVIDAFTKVKDSLVDAFTKVKEAIAPLWESIKDLGAALYDFYENSGLKTIVGLFAELLVSLGGSVLSTAITVLADVFSGLTQALAGVAEIATGILEFFNGLLTLDFERMIEGISSVGEGIMKFFGGMAEQTFGAGIDLIEGLLAGIAEAIVDIGEWLKESVVDPFIDNFKRLFGIHSPSTVMEEQGGFIMQGLFNGIANLVDFVASPFGDLKEKIVKKCGELKENASQRFEELKTNVKNSMDKTGRDIETGWNTIQEKFQKFDNFLSGVFSTDWSNSFGGFGEVMNGFMRSASDIWENIKGIFRGVTDFVAGVFSGDWRRAWEGVKTIFRNIWEGFGNIIKTPINTVIGFLNGLIGGVESAVNSIAKMLNGLKIKAPGWVTKLTGITSIGFNLPTWTAGRIPYLARGGLVTSPTLAVTGENYRKEAVLPLENPRSMRLIAQSIMAEAPTGSMKDDIKQAVMEGIVNVAMNNSANNQGSQAPIYITVQLENDEAIARAAIRGQKQIDYRMNPTPQFGF